MAGTNQQDQIYSLVSYGNNPFNDLASLYFPDNVKELFRLSRAIYFNNGLVRQAVKKLSEYPITKLEYHAISKDGTPLIEADNIEERYRHIFEDILNIESFLIRFNIDYFVYGNAFVTVYFPFIRKLRCKNCEKIEKSEGTPIRDLLLSDIADWKYEANKYRGTCPDCKKKVEFVAHDETDQKEDNIRLIQWNPEHIDIKYFQFTGERIYTYTPDTQYIEKIVSGDRDTIERTPQAILDAIRDNKVVRLNSKDLFHFIAEGPTDDQQEWGKAIVLCSFKNIFYMQILRKGAEAIAKEHITPFRVVFPTLSGTEGIGGVANIYMKKFERRFKVEYLRWRIDPNHLAMMPFPVGQTRMGGDGRAMLPTAEIQQAAEEVFLALGLPRGLILGEANWASNSIAMRIVENAWLTLRDQMAAIINFIRDRVRDYLNLPLCEITMKEFKSIDDISHKQMMFGFMQARLISKERMLSLYDIDYVDETKAIQKEMMEEATAQADAQSKMMQIQMEKQMEMQTLQTSIAWDMQIDQANKMSKEIMSMVESYMTQGWPLDQAIQMVMSIQAQQQAMAQQQAIAAQAEQARQLFLQDRSASSAYSLARAQRQLEMFNIMNAGQPTPPAPPMAGPGMTYDANTVNQLVINLMQLDPDTRNKNLESLRGQDSVLYERVINYLAGMGVQSGEQPGASVASAQPLPQNGPPKRNGVIG